MKYKETETLELKKSTSELKEAIISISAMLNKHGKGTVYFGINDDGTVVGQIVGKSTLRDISKSISDHIDPKIYPNIKVEKIENKDCVVVDFAGHKALYSAFGRFYLRSVDEDKKLSADEIEKLVDKKKGYVYLWGGEVSETTVSAVSIPVLRSFIKKGRETGRIGFAFDTARNVLNKLNLIKGDKLLNAGRALFCKDNGIKTRAAIFATDEKTTFLDIQSFKGTLFDLIAQCETYVKEHINWRADIVDFKRVETPEVPIKAVREAIVNSLCHRDFADSGDNEIGIYKNRIEIYNPGQFPFDYSPEDFIKGKEKSIPRNPLIADVFYMTRDVEQWGSGLKRISDECKAAGIKVSFEKIKSGFLVAFHRPAIKTNVKITGKVSGRGLVERLVEGLVENQKNMLGLMRMNPNISKQELSNKIGISTTAIDKNITQLKKKVFFGA